MSLIACASVFFSELELIFALFFVVLLVLAVLLVFAFEVLCAYATMIWLCFSFADCFPC